MKRHYLGQWFSTGLAMGPTFSSGRQAATHIYQNLNQSNLFLKNGWLDTHIQVLSHFT